MGAFAANDQVDEGDGTVEDLGGGWRRHLKALRVALSGPGPFLVLVRGSGSPCPASPWTAGRVVAPSTYEGRRAIGLSIEGMRTDHANRSRGREAATGQRDLPLRHPERCVASTPAPLIGR